MSIPQSLEGRNIKYLNLYPALKQSSKDKIDFASSNTKTDQLYVRKLLVKRVRHYHEFNAFKTIVLDSRYVQKARRNLHHSKSFKHVQLHISEPAVFGLIAKIMRQLRKKTIDTLTVHFEVKENNLNIGQLVLLASIFPRTRVLNFSFDGAKEESCLKILPSISLMLEKNAFLENQKVNVTFRGIFAFLTNHIAAPMRYWREINSVQVTPSNVYGPIQLPELNKPTSVRRANNLKMTFEFLKKFEAETLRSLANNLNLLQKIQILTLVLNRFELVKEKPGILGDFIQDLHLQRGIKLIIYYVKYQKMNFEKIFNAIEAQADQMKELVLGHLVIKEEIKTPLVQVLIKLNKLKSLKIYWEIKDSLETQQKNNLWEFFNDKQNLESVDIILTCTSTVLEENNSVSQSDDLENSLKNLLQTLGKLPQLRNLRLALPEIKVDIGSLVNDMVMESASLKTLKLECDEYNLNYLLELREIQKMKNLLVQVSTGEKDSLQDLETTQDFKLTTFFNSYDHFTQIHQQFYLHNI